MEELPVTDNLRLVTWNVHSCIGLDGRVDVDRIADVLASLEPDVVALQEVEVGCARTGGIDQPGHIARRLGMHASFQAAVNRHEGCYGIATLSRKGHRPLKGGPLPRLPWPFVEPRVAMAVGVGVDGARCVVVNTHLGLVWLERRRQVAALLGPHWLGTLLDGDPLILCGDLNSSPNAAECRTLGTHLTDAFQGSTPAGTFPSHFPLLRLDHVMLGPRLERTRVEVVRTPQAVQASDHLPVVVDLRILSGEGVRTPAPEVAAPGEQPRRPG